MSCNCNSGDTPEYYITLDGVGANGYSPEINVTQEDTASFRLNLINKDNEQLTPVIPKLSYLNDNFVTNSVFSTTLANYSTTAQIATTYLSKADAVTTYLKVDGSNATNPITLNNFRVQSVGTGTRVGSEGQLTLYGSTARPAYIPQGDTPKSLALFSDIPATSNLLITDGSNATSNIAINGIAFRNQSNFNNIIKAKDGLSLELTNGGSVVDYTRATIYLTTSGNAEISGDNNVNLSAVNDIHLKTTNGKAYYGATTDATKEIATLGNINNATITFTQGGVTKGTFTLNQSSNATIALDAGGGGVSGNQISLITEDSTRSLTLGVNNTTKRAFANLIINEGGIAILPIKLINTVTAPISLVEGNDGLSTVNLDYDTNSLDVDTNNKLAVDSDYIEAHKAYLADGDLLTDSQGLEDVKYYNKSSFDLSKFIVVGTPTITDDGIASGFSNSNYLAVNLSSVLPATIDNVTITGEVTYISQAGISTIIGGSGNNNTPRVYFGNTGNLGFYLYDGSTTHQAAINFAGIIQNGDKVKFTVTFSNKNITASATINNGTPLATSSNRTMAVNFTTALATLSIGHFGSSYSICSINLKQFSVTPNGQEVFSGNKTGVDTYTIGSDTITIPYKVSKTGSKIVDSSLRPEVEAVCEDQGYAPYYTLDETNGNFTLPMGEIYGYITRLEGIVKDLQTRLTALESNINGGGASEPVQQGLLGMSPLSLGRPQLLDELNPVDELDTMDIEPIEEDIQEEELEPQETEEETEEGGQNE